MFKYKDAEEYINNLSNRGIILGLKSMEDTLKNLDNPQSFYKKVHIAGTNGKGSVSAFIAQMLIEAGYKTGLYNSPFVKDRLEIIKVDGKNITKDEYAECIFEVKSADKNNCITAYEAETLAAFLWFKKCECDIAVIETGLGGTLDATNAMGDKVCAVITSVSMDHKNILGNTVEEIAQNKAGIIKNTNFAIIAEQDENVKKVISDKCEKENAKLIMSDFSKIKNISFKDLYQKFDYGDIKNISLSLLGQFQTENASVALETIFCLKNNGFNISEKNIYDGLKNAQHKGRFEIISRKPLFILDGAHNEKAAIMLSKTLKEYFKTKKMYFIMGVFKDKDYKKIIEIMMPLCEYAYAVEPFNDRALKKEQLATEIEKINKNVCACSISEAVKKSAKRAGKDGVVVAFGSLSFLKDVQFAFDKNKN